MSAIITDLRMPIRHPGRTRMSRDEQLGRGVVDLKEAVQSDSVRLPDFCGNCGAWSSMSNPLRFIPVDSNPKKLAQAYLYKAVCGLGCKG